MQATTWIVVVVVSLCSSVMINAHYCDIKGIGSQGPFITKTFQPEVINGRHVLVQGVVKVTGLYIHF